jgi:hypothetical protein
MSTLRDAPVMRRDEIEYDRDLVDRKARRRRALLATLARHYGSANAPCRQK